MRSIVLTRKAELHDEREYALTLLRCHPLPLQGEFVQAVVVCVLLCVWPRFRLVGGDFTGFESTSLIVPALGMT